MSIDLDAIQARVDAANLGKLDYGPAEGGFGFHIYPHDSDSAIGFVDDMFAASLFANASNDVPALLALVRELEARIGRVREMHQQHVEFMECVNCCGDWPCPTSTALSEATGGAR